MDTILIDVPTNMDARCPYCKKEITAFAGKRMPRLGDPGLCAYCYQIYIYNEDLTLRKPNLLETVSLNNNAEFQHAIRKAIEMLKKGRRER